MSETSQARELKKVLGDGTRGTKTDTTYVRLRPLTEKEIASGYNYLVLPAGNSIAGTLKSTFIDNFDKTNYVIEWNGEKTAIAAPNGLNAKLKSVPMGSYVEIVYNGMEVMTGGKNKGKEAHSFDVLTDDAGGPDTDGDAA